MTHYLLYNEETLILVILRKWPQKVKYLHCCSFLLTTETFKILFKKSKVKELPGFNKFLWSESGNKSKTFGTNRMLIVFVILKCFKASLQKGLKFENPWGCPKCLHILLSECRNRLVNSMTYISS